MAVFAWRRKWKQMSGDAAHTACMQCAERLACPCADKPGGHYLGRPVLMDRCGASPLDLAASNLAPGSVARAPALDLSAANCACVCVCDAGMHTHALCRQADSPSGHVTTATPQLAARVLAPASAKLQRQCQLPYLSRLQCPEGSQSP